MNDFQDDELMGLLQRLGEVQPTAEATEQALDRVRRALAEAPIIKLPSTRRVKLKVYVAAAAAVMLAGSVTGWLLLRSPASASAGFVQVRNAMKRPASVTYRQTVRVKGEPDVITRLLILHKGLWRSEKNDGSYTITDIGKQRVLSVVPLRREATLQQGLDIAENSLYEALTRLANNSSARALPDKKIYGTDVVGYTVTVQARNFRVWASVKTQLPVRIEVEGKDDQGRSCEIVVDQFVFGRDLDPELFAFWVPTGYKLTTHGVSKLPAAPLDSRPQDLVLTPMVGLGPVKFGMTIEEVEKHLGKADEVQQTTNGNFAMSYRSRGFSMQVSKTRGVWAISCLAQAAMVARVRDFSGQTDKGLALGASAADIVGLYGQPDSAETRNRSTFMVYGKLQAHFTLLDDKLVQIWVSHLPAK